MSLKFAAKVHIYDRSGFTKPRLVLPCGASFLMQQTWPTITVWWRNHLTRRALRQARGD
jgi:hypothetical protein